MTEITTKKKFDLEERTFQFAGNVRRLIKSIPRNMIESSDRDQLSRSSGSVAANYIEANESLSAKDFVMRMKICRKEARESQLWLRLVKDQVEHQLQEQADKLADESTQLVRIFNSIIFKYKEK